MPAGAEVLVVGGGPAGASTAFFLARAGCDVVVVDRARFPRDKPGSEYLSPQASRLLHAMGALEALEQEDVAHLTGMRIVAPDGSEALGSFAASHGYRGFRDRGLAVRRTILDARLLDRARAAGARVVVTSRDGAKREAALAAGAAEALDSGAERWDVEADVVAESVGAATWTRSMAALVPAGRLVVCGATSGGTVELALPRLWFKQVEVIGSTMASYEEFAEVTRLVAQGLPLVVDREVPVDAYPDALARLRKGDQNGKIVLLHGG